MQIIYADKSYELDEANSIFLAGPTPRSITVASWRPEAIFILKRLGYQGQILIPERQDLNYENLIEQIEWEEYAMDNCGTIVMWMPRDLVTLPGFTSNIEFGKYYDDNRFVYGRPPNTPHTRYMDHDYRKAEEEDDGIIWRDEIPETLEDLMSLALENLYAFQGGVEANVAPPEEDS